MFCGIFHIIFISFSDMYMCDTFEWILNSIRSYIVVSYLYTHRVCTNTFSNTHKPAGYGCTIISTSSPSLSLSLFSLNIYFLFDIILIPQRWHCVRCWRLHWEAKSKMVFMVLSSVNIPNAFFICIPYKTN